MGARTGIRVGVVGVGRIGAFHARSLLSLDAVESVTLGDLDPARAASLAAELGAESAPSTEALVEADIDALVIAAPTPAHRALLSLAAAANIPVFCEKPVALDLPALDAVIAESEAAEILVQVGFQRRFDAGYRAAREAVASGALGKTLVLRAATHDPSPPPEAYIAASGGIFRDLHIHDFDAIRFVTGREIVEVYADGAVRAAPWFADHDDVDVATAVLRLDDGTLAIVSGTRHDPLGYDVRLEVFGTKDSIVVGVDDHSPIRSVEPGAPKPKKGYANFMERFAAAYRAELETFVECVRDGIPSPCTLQDARAALAVAVAADRSRAERAPVRV
ncbi:MAG TPA: Gfo/Idh/MocA family oxidoreductase [Gaiellaceae bacterium]|jgi:myo-inositol 2-dehydrogenase/D-chiro-inositol 1-dehydrogenase